MNTKIVKFIVYFSQKAILFGPHFNLSKLFSYTTYLFSKKGEKTTVIRN
jgi:hypothetical protein